MDYFIERQPAPTDDAVVEFLLLVTVQVFGGVDDAQELLA